MENIDLDQYASAIFGPGIWLLAACLMCCDQVVPVPPIPVRV
jgi:hypothetical protein